MSVLLGIVEVIRPPEGGNMCWICDHPGATERDYTEHMRRLITAYGWEIGRAHV